MMNASSAALVVLLNLHDKLVEKRQRTVDLFRMIDESGDGVVDPEEFRAGLDAFGFTTSDEDFKSLMEVLDKEYVTQGCRAVVFVVMLQKNFRSRTVTVITSECTEHRRCVPRMCVHAHRDTASNTTALQ